MRSSLGSRKSENKYKTRQDKVFFHNSSQIHPYRVSLSSFRYFQLLCAGLNCQSFVQNWYRIVSYRIANIRWESQVVFVPENEKVHKQQNNSQQTQESSKHDFEADRFQQTTNILARLSPATHHKCRNVLTLNSSFQLELISYRYSSCCCSFSGYFFKKSLLLLF